MALHTGGQRWIHQTCPWLFAAFSSQASGPCLAKSAHCRTCWQVRQCALFERQIRLILHWGLPGALCVLLFRLFAWIFHSPALPLSITANPPNLPLPHTSHGMVRRCIESKERKRAPAVGFFNFLNQTTRNETTRPKRFLFFKNVWTLATYPQTPKTSCGAVLGERSCCRETTGFFRLDSEMSKNVRVFYVQAPKHEKLSLAPSKSTFFPCKSNTVTLPL